MLQERFVHAKLICLYVQGSWTGENAVPGPPSAESGARGQQVKGLGVLKALQVLSRQRDGKCHEGGMRDSAADINPWKAGCPKPWLPVAPWSTRKGADCLPEIRRDAAAPAAHVVPSPSPATKLHFLAAKQTLNNAWMSEQAVGEAVGEGRRSSWSIQEQREGRRGWEAELGRGWGWHWAGGCWGQGQMSWNEVTSAVTVAEAVARSIGRFIGVPCAGPGHCCRNWM